jgi:integrative and conjugative element protein (TIGR02256 family)
MTPTIYLCISAFEAIRTEAALWSGAETGGILGGYEMPDAVVITHATGPGPNCRRSMHSIVLDTAYLQEQTDRFAELDLQYQGSWHTHPTTGLLRPSPTDRRLLRAGAWSRRYRLQFASVMFIARDTVASVEDVLALTCRKRRLLVQRSPVVLTRDWRQAVR